MKLSFWDRILICLFVVIMVVLCLLTALRVLNVDLIGAALSGLDQAAGKFAQLLIVFGLALVFTLLGVYVLSLCLRGEGKKQKNRCISVETGEGGRVSIAMSALEQMARQAIGPVDGVNDMQIRIDGDESAISVGVVLSLNASAHVPSVTAGMQRTIRQRIEENCGVGVRSVDITVATFSEEPPRGKEKSGFRVKRGRVMGKVEKLPKDAAACPPDRDASEGEASFEADDALPFAPLEMHSAPGGQAPEADAETKDAVEEPGRAEDIPAQTHAGEAHAEADDLFTVSSDVSDDAAPDDESKA